MGEAEFAEADDDAEEGKASKERTSKKNKQLDTLLEEDEDEEEEDENEEEGNKIENVQVLLFLHLLLVVRMLSYILCCRQSNTIYHIKMLTDEDKIHFFVLSLFLFLLFFYLLGHHFLTSYSMFYIFISNP